MNYSVYYFLLIIYVYFIMDYVGCRYMYKYTYIDSGTLVNSMELHIEYILE